MQKLTVLLELIAALFRVERQAAIKQILGTFCCDTKNGTAEASAYFSAKYIDMMSHCCRMQKKKKRSRYRDYGEKNSSTRSRDMEEM